MPVRIIYMGSPDFAVGPLHALIQNGYPVVAVVTVPDKPAGRGKHLTPSPVKQYALKCNIPLLQPESLKDEGFLKQLDTYNPDLQIIVAFRILPEVVWNRPPLGSINLHASLLPQYRGAAPIHWAIINGETMTGVTTFFLTHKVDTGQLLFQEMLPIAPDETAGEVHDRLMAAGSELILKTVRAIEAGDCTSIDQQSLIRQGMELKSAPRIFKEDCRINWSGSAVNIHNKIRGLSPAPGAFTEFRTPKGDTISIKIFRSTIKPAPPSDATGQILTDGKTYLAVTTSDGILYLQELQLASKNRMPVVEFLKGFKPGHDWVTL